MLRDQQLQCHEHRPGRLAPAALVAADRAAARERIEPAGAQTALERGQRSLRLPLGSGNKIVCSTCHNPHQAGVFPAGSDLAIGHARGKQFQHFELTPTQTVPGSLLVDRTMTVAHVVGRRWRS